MDCEYLSVCGFGVFLSGFPVRSLKADKRFIHSGPFLFRRIGVEATTNYSGIQWRDAGVTLRNTRVTLRNTRVTLRNARVTLERYGRFGL